VESFGKETHETREIQGLTVNENVSEGIGVKGIHEILETRGI
jgi:hypothetical protein